ncbi:MAG: multifunctional transcriptional regulator/nicotinamide-nucleotide adenylyltransferase/ribosylnicotinamide kinase NadR [Arsenophonus sp.]|nr:MAG: multifunctional transcriptional regulator/nicotinamide-nucleotide adenylyltransferase/ribosylnicotinamide kinase NadR [Arsenophonus sp.]
MKKKHIIYQDKFRKIHNFSDVQYNKKIKKVGIIFGKFYPLHTGHIYLIQRAYSQVKNLYIILCYDKKRDKKLFTNSSMSQQPTVSDRLRWLLQTFKYQKNIHIFSFNETNKKFFYTWKKWSTRIKIFLIKNKINPDIIYSGNKCDEKKYKKYFSSEVKIIDSNRTFMNISGEKIRQHPFRYWEYIPMEVKPFFVRKVTILGGESSGKSILVNKLANIFNTTSAWEYGRKYIFSHLGGSEMALQYSDYDKIALGHAKYIDFAVKYANKVTFIDTDFITTQAFCKYYEGKFHPFVQVLIDKYKFDLVILLKNNTPWINDGIRKLGNNKDRKNFQNLLIELLIKNRIKFVIINSPSYEERFLNCVKLVKKLIMID